MIYTDILQGSNEWHQLRLGKVTASKADDLLTEPRSKADKEAGKLSATATTLMLALIGERLTGKPAMEFQTTAMKWGSDHEAEARFEFTVATGLEVDRVAFADHPDLPLVGCSPDGLVGDSATLEIKAPFNTSEHLRTILSAEVPDEYVAQVQFQLWVLNRQRCYFVTYDPRMPEDARLFWIEVPRDEDKIDQIKTAVERFLARYQEAAAQIAVNIAKMEVA